MFITTNGIVVNDKQQVLLVQRSDSRTFAPPGGGLDFGELPPAGAMREVFEETGLTVSIQRLAAVYYWPNEPTPFLTFSFLCQPINGHIRPSNETPKVGFFDPHALPFSLLPFHRHRVRVGLNHTAATPRLVIQQMTFYEDLGKRFLGRVVYPYWRLKERLAKKPKTISGFALWQVKSLCILKNEAGQLLWVRESPQSMWQLPGGCAADLEAPWQTAIRIVRERTGLTISNINLGIVYLTSDTPTALFVFSAVVRGGTLAKSPTITYVSPGQEPANTLSPHIKIAADAVQHPHATTFKYQTTLVEQNNG